MKSPPLFPEFSNAMKINSYYPYCHCDDHKVIKILTATKKIKKEYLKIKEKGEEVTLVGLVIHSLVTKNLWSHLH